MISLPGYMHYDKTCCLWWEFSLCSWLFMIECQMAKILGSLFWRIRNLGQVLISTCVCLTETLTKAARSQTGLGHHILSLLTYHVIRFNGRGTCEQLVATSNIIKLLHEVELETLNEWNQIDSFVRRSFDKQVTKQRHSASFQKIKNLKYTFCREFNSEYLLWVSLWWRHCDVIYKH